MDGYKTQSKSDYQNVKEYHAVFLGHQGSAMLVMEVWGLGVIKISDGSTLAADIEVKICISVLEEADPVVIPHYHVLDFDPYEVHIRF